MANNIDDVVDSIQGLRVSDNAPLSPSTGPALQEALQKLYRSTGITTSCAKDVESLAGNTNPFSSLQITEICSLHNKARTLAVTSRILDDAAQSLKNVAGKSMVAHLTSSYEPRLRDILSHFNDQMRDIVEGVLNDYGDDNEVLWRIAEECYNQATKASGKLDFDDYWYARRQVAVGRPYDLDFESEDYHEHEDRLGMDEDYDKGFYEMGNEDQENIRKRARQNWVDYWASKLNRYPGGPTLFMSSDLDNADIPQYLFRTFDTKSSGKNNDRVVASTMSTIGCSENSRIDLLSLKRRKATSMLHTHLTKECAGEGSGSDNLMSWTSSLLFAIQYAIWRCHTFGCGPSDIQICVVDTRKFPRGQFAKDLRLLKEYQSTAQKLGGKTQQYFDFRLADKDYQNGEYFSQGSLNHSGRSCMASLETLENSGLYKLYFEFEDAQGKKSWANRVLELRRLWSETRETTIEEIQLAFKVAQMCFPEFKAIDMALSLLTFKDRKYYPTGSTTARESVKENIDNLGRLSPEWSQKPIEVHRYFITSELIKLSEHKINGMRPPRLDRSGSNSSEIQMVKKLMVGD